MRTRNRVEERTRGSFVGLRTKQFEATMNREQEYRRLADNAFTRAVEEDSAQLMAQWKILGARYLELADLSKNIDMNDTFNDPML
jgi:hypothetical protein